MPQVPPIKVVVPEIEEPDKCSPLPDPLPIQGHNIRWVVLTPETLFNHDDPKVKELLKNQKWVYFALLPEDYEKLALTNADTLRWIKESVWRLAYYKKECIGADNG